jgi:hypothetical protein
MVGQRVIVAAHALMPGKQMKYYQETFEEIYGKTRPMQPKKFI